MSSYKNSSDIIPFDIYVLLNKILGSITLILTIFGIFGNVFTAFICMRKKLRCITTFVFLAFISGNDLLTLLIWNLDQYFEAFFNFSHEFLSVWWCKMCVFIQYFCLHNSAWLLVIFLNFFLN